MARFEALDRRTFIAQLGRATLGIVVLGAAACASDEPDRAGATMAPTPTSGDGALGAWLRVDLGNVSAYALVRDGEAVVVDTGVAGSADDIEAALSETGHGWGDVGHLILTHKHPDHVGSVEEVLTRAGEATVYAGAEDIPAITAPREITAVGDGQSVLDLEIVATPGHTPGHISVLDRQASVFVAGDALVTADGRAALPVAEFSEDMDEALSSVEKIAGIGFDTLYVGHGEPVASGAGDQVAELV